MALSDEIKKEPRNKRKKISKQIAELVSFCKEYPKLWHSKNFFQDTIDSLEDEVAKKSIRKSRV